MLHNNRFSYYACLAFTVFVLLFCGRLQAQQSYTLVPPTATNDTILIGKNQEILIDVIANDSDPDNNLDPSTINNTSSPTQGFLSIENNKFKYKPNPNYCGSDSFRYTVSDFLGVTSNIATVYINISCVNLPPDAKNDMLIINEDVPGSTDLSQNDYLSDGPDAYYVISSLPLFGTAQLSTSGILTYTPYNNYNGTDSFKYVLRDNDPLLPLTDTATVYIIVASVNDAPVAVNDTFTTKKNSVLVTEVLSNDASIDGPSENYVLIQSAAHGTAVLYSDGILNYTPATDYVGKDTLRYALCDGASINLCDSAYVFIDVLPTYPLPVAVNDTLKLLMNEMGEVNVLRNDFSTNGDLMAGSFQFVSVPLHASSFHYSDSVLIYTPQPGFTGKDSCSYTIKDEIDSVSNIATIIFIVKEAPFAGNVCNNEVEENSTVAIPVFLNAVAGTEAIDKSRVFVTDAPDHGALLPYNSFDQTITYVPAAGYTGADTFYFIIYDVDGFESDTAYACIEVKEKVTVHPVGMLTPNNDGRNDVWIVEGIEGFPDNKVVIFDRYGNEVFRTTNYSAQNNWNGENLPAGTYFYLIEINMNDRKQTMKGYITLLK